MAGFIAKQPNGLYCRFSTVVDAPTHYDMPFEGYVALIMERGMNYGDALDEAKDIVENHLRPFDEVVERFIPNNMNEKEFNSWLKSVGYDFNKYKKIID